MAAAKPAEQDKLIGQTVVFNTVGEDNSDIVVSINGDQRQFKRDTEITIGEESGQIPPHYVHFLKTCRVQVQKKRRNPETGRDEEYHDSVLRFPFTVF